MLTNGSLTGHYQQLPRRLRLFSNATFANFQPECDSPSLWSLRFLPSQRVLFLWVQIPPYPCSFTKYELMYASQNPQNTDDSSAVTASSSSGSVSTSAGSGAIPGGITGSGSMTNSASAFMPTSTSSSSHEGAEDGGHGHGHHHKGCRKKGHDLHQSYGSSTMDAGGSIGSYGGMSMSTGPSASSLAGSMGLSATASASTGEYGSDNPDDDMCEEGDEYGGGSGTGEPIGSATSQPVPVTGSLSTGAASASGLASSGAGPSGSSYPSNSQSSGSSTTSGAGTQSSESY
ncbi:hypothetical protein ACEPAF_2746 [Sanghuangporus sanghuang]